VEGVNHCRLAKSANFRDMMIMWKYGAVIGWKSRVVVYYLSEFSGYEVFPANHGAVFPHDHQVTECSQTTV